MANLDFPKNPSDGQTYTANGITYRWINSHSNWQSEGFGTGSNTQIYFNDSGYTNTSANLTWNKTSNTLTVGNTIAVGANIIVNTTIIFLGNSTVNTVINSTASLTQNSTANLSLATDTLSMSHRSDPATPATNVMAFYTQSVGGRMMPRFLGPSGVSVTPSPHWGRNRIIMYQAQWNNTTSATWGWQASNTIATTARTPATTNLFLSMTRLGINTNTTANNSGELRHNHLQFVRGNATGMGGFHFVCRFGPAVIAAQGCFFIGFKDSNTLMTSATGASAQTNIIGFGCDRAQTNLFAISANSTASNTQDLGASFPVNVGNTEMYEAIIFAPPNGGTIRYQVTNLRTGTVAYGTYNQTNLPSTTTFLQPKLWVNNGTTAGVHAIDIVSIYIEVDN